MLHFFQVWAIVPGFKGVGFGQLVGTASVISYYCCLIALSLHFFFSSFQSVLPWTVCHQSLSQEGHLCVTSTSNYSAAEDRNLTNQTLISAAEQYFKRSVLKEKVDISDGIGVPDLELTSCLALCWIMLFFTLWKGVASSGKVAYFTAIFPYFVLLVLLIRGLTLPGAMDGVLFYITPKWSELVNLKVWYAAVTQSFFSLSTGFGAIITYSSYNNFKHDCYRDAFIISIVDTITSLLSGFVIFSILGSLAFELKIPVKNVLDSGPGLAFVSYPSALAKFDVFPQLFSLLFFLMLVTLGLGSATGLTSGIVSVLCDLDPSWNRTFVTGFTCIVGFLIGLIYVTPGGQAILTLVDYFGGSFVIFVLTMFEVVAVSWVYGANVFIRDVKFMLNVHLGFYWKFCWEVFVPISLFSIMVYFLATYKPVTYQNLPYPDLAILAGFLLTIFAIIQVPVWLGIAIFQRGVRSSMTPSCYWGPSQPDVREEWKKLDWDAVTKF